MSQVAISGNASGTGTLTIAAPNTNSNYTLTLPTGTGTFNISGVVNEVPAGTVSAPSIYPTGDTNTGIFFPAADTIAFAEGGAEAMRIDSSGRMLIGTTTKTDAQRLNIAYDNDTSTGFRMYCNSGTYNGAAIDFLNVGGTRVGYILPSSTGTTYSTSSDYRLKENIAPMQGALSVVQQLKPCTYTWKSDGSDGQGFIAHELQAVVPDCVTGEKDAVDADGNPVYQGIDTSFLVATLTAAIQEQQALIQQLQADVAELKGATP